MNNEIGRKITSLTLMTIMLAGGMLAAVPSMVPAAHAANANLFVSAENSQFNNYMSGPQVIEVVVIDSDIKDTDKAKGEPDVTMNGKKLRMAQATDGNWYGYFADLTMATLSDATVTSAGRGLDFGQFCSSTSQQLSNDGSSLFTDTSGVAIPVRSSNSTGTFGVNGTAIIPACDTNFTGRSVSSIGFPGAGVGLNYYGANSTHTGNTAISGVEGRVSDVVREAKALSGVAAGTQSGTSVSLGQIKLKDEGLWPYVQLYTLSVGGNVVVQYNKGGGVQTTTLTFDTVDQFAKITTDRVKYTQGSEVHATITDLWLNIDPTDEDSWTFSANSTNTQFGSYYNVFNENGNNAGDSATATSATPQLSKATLQTLMCEENCLVSVNPDKDSSGVYVVRIQDTADSRITPGANVVATATAGGKLTRTSVPVTFTETSANTGVFGSYDELDASSLKITDNAKRGTSATIAYVQTVPNTILVGFDFATINIAPTDSEWNSGEEIPITLVDSDANKNSRADEDLDLNIRSTDVIPSLVTGDPFTLGENAFVTQINNINDASAVSTGTLGNSTKAILVAITDAQFINNNTGLTGAGNFPAAKTITGLIVDSKNMFAPVQKFSDRLLLANSTTNGNLHRNAIVIDLNTNAKELRNSIKNGTSPSLSNFYGINLLNFDIRSLNTTGTTEIGLIYRMDGGSAPIINASSTNGITWGHIQEISLYNTTSSQGLINLNVTQSSSVSAATAGEIHQVLFRIADDSRIGIIIKKASTTGNPINNIISADSQDITVKPIVVDLFTFGFVDDGQTSNERIGNQIIRLELEETGDNTSTFAGTLEFTMINQLNILTPSTYTGIRPIDNQATFVVMDDLDTEDAPRANYLDLGADGVRTQVADQQDAGTHSGVVSLDNQSYKVADTVTVTLADVDLNVDTDLIDIYTAVSPLNSEPASDAVGKAGLPIRTGNSATNLFSFGSLGRLLDITFDDERWINGTKSFTNDKNVAVSCPSDSTQPGADNGLFASGFTLIETSSSSGLFTGDFQIPDKYCARSGQGTAGVTGVYNSVTGTDIEVNYLDFRDASGQIVEVGDSAGVRANTGSVSFDRTVYPVPFGVLADVTANAASTPASHSLFPIHATGLSGNINTVAEILNKGDLAVHVRVNDPDFDTSAAGEDKIATTGSVASHGPVKVTTTRGASSLVLATAGASSVLAGTISVGTTTLAATRELGPITEISPDSGIFEFDLPIRYTDGPASSLCPVTNVFTNLDGAGTTVTDRFSAAFATTTTGYCLLQGDIITVEYTDPTDASGNPTTVTDSATFDLRNGVLQSDKSVYIIGGDMILTLIEPDFDLDNDSAETYDLDLIEWDSDAGTVTIGNQGSAGDGSSTSSGGIFDPEPTDFRETGDNTGIFQVVLEIPSRIGNDNLNRGEEIVLEYTDWGPSGSDYVGGESEDVNLTIFTSNFGATVELDQKVYTWTDKVYITIVAPDHNQDSNLIDEVGDTAKDPIKVATRGHSMKQYKLVETGVDTGIFTGEVILTGFNHDADGNTATGTATNGYDTTPVTGTIAGATATGPTDGYIQADDDDGLTISFEFSEDETVVGSALIRWNIGEVQWLEASYPASGTGVVRIIDPDMNLKPEAVDNFNVDTWSDSDAGGIDLTVTETNEATGIFEGTVFFTTTDESSGHRLRVAEGDTVTANYQDNTLPNPYTTADELDISATSLIGTIVPPLERAPAANLRIVDAFGNSLSTVNVDQQVQLTADLANGQDREQAFAYLVQIQDGNGVTVSLAWITGSLSAGQSFSPALSWIPTEAGTYTATAFVWESVDNPTALSPPVSTTVIVQ